MSETSAETGTDLDVVGGDLELSDPDLDIIDAEIVPDDEQGVDEIDGEVIDTPTDVTPWALPEAAPIGAGRQGPNDGARPTGGSGGGGGGAFSGKISSKERRRRQRAAGGNGGGGAHYSIFGGIFSGASLFRTGPVGSGNALVKGRTGSGHTGAVLGGSAGRIAGRSRRSGS